MFRHFTANLLGRNATDLPGSTRFHTFRVPITKDVELGHKLTCSVNKVEGVAFKFSDRILECSSALKANAQNITIRFYAHIEDFAAEVLVDSVSYRVIKELRNPTLLSDPIFLSGEPLALRLNVLEGYRPGSTFCVIGDAAVPFIQESETLFLCEFTAAMTAGFLSKEQLHATNFAEQTIRSFKDNLVSIQELKKLSIGFLKKPLDRQTLPVLMFLGHLEPLVLSTRFEPSDYAAYSDLSLKCSLEEAHFRYEKSCRFTSESLTEIEIDTRRLAPRTYSLVLELAGVSYLHADVLKVTPQPVLNDIYPPIVHTYPYKRKSDTFWIYGRNFALLRDGFKCVLTFVEEGGFRHMFLEATVVDDRTLACTVLPHQVYQQARVSVQYLGRNIDFVWNERKPMLLFEPLIHLTGVAPRILTANSGQELKVSLSQAIN